MKYLESLAHNKETQKVIQTILTKYGGEPDGAEIEKYNDKIIFGAWFRVKFEDWKEEDYNKTKQELVDCGYIIR